MESGYGTTPSPASSSSGMVSSPSSQMSSSPPYSLTNMNISYVSQDEYLYSQQVGTSNRMICSPNSAVLDSNCKVSLEILEQPVDKFRFRYKSEMHGTHGSLMGARTEKQKRSYPTVELRGYNGKAIIRCSLYQTGGALKPLPHSHRLVVRNGDDDISDPHDLHVSPDEGFQAIFQGMGIIHTAKKHIVDELIIKKKREEEFMQGRSLTKREEAKVRIEKFYQKHEAFSRLLDYCSRPIRTLENLSENLSKLETAEVLNFDANKEAKIMNLNQVCLGFQAFAVNDDNTLTKLCELKLSNPINNMKSALTGELKISRLSVAVSSSAGGDDLFIFVEKVGKKNIKVRFFEVDENEEEVWEDWGQFSEADVHHQYAIALRTPPYSNRDIDRHVDVFIQLIRPSDMDRSEPLAFRYKPRDYISRKRARMSSSACSSSEIPESVLQAVKEPMTISNEFHKSDLINMFGMLGSCDEFLKQVSTDQEFLSDMDFGFDHLERDGVRRNERAIQRIGIGKNASHVNKSEKKYLDEYRKIMTIFRKNGQKNSETTRLEIENIFTSSDEDILHSAIKNNDTNVLIRLLSLINKLQLAKKVLNFLNEKEQTCLHFACIYDRSEYIRPLLSLGANPNIQDYKGNTPLHIAIKENMLSCVSRIIEKSNYTSESEPLHINLANNEGLTALHLAVKNKNLVLTKLLIESGGASVKLNISKNGYNVLHIAVEQEDEEMVQYLLQNTKVNVKEPNNSGYTPLQLAKSMKSAPKIKELLSPSGGNDYEDEIAEKMSTSSTESESDDDSTDRRLQIDENDENSRIFDDDAIEELTEILNKDKRWLHFGTYLNMSFVTLCEDVENPSKMLLNLINSPGRTEFSETDVVEAFSSLNIHDAVTCLENMKKRRKL